MRAKITFVLSIALLFLSFSVFAQQAYWREVSLTAKEQSFLKPNVNKGKAKLFELDFKALLNQLNAQQSSKVLLPDTQGALRLFELQAYSQLAPDLAMKYPNIKSYKATRSDSDEVLWLSISKEGIQLMGLNPKSKYNTYLEPSSKSSKYYTFYSSSQKSDVENFVCTTKDYNQSSRTVASSSAAEAVVFRTYRLAVSTSGEYTAYHGGTVEGALSAINATLTRVNGIFNRDLGVKLELISSTVSVIYTDADTDPYDSDYNGELQTTLDDVIGSDNYDIGHLFTQGSSNGNAGFIGGICRAGKKGSAFTSGANPEGDLFDIDYVAHEMGHQLGANHTWSYQSEGTYAQVEPGSGTTIMSYAGIVGGENVASSASAYFNGISIEQITATLENSVCGVIESVSNTKPELSSLSNYNIPLKTPFKLTAVASDLETQSSMTYIWEQVDAGIVPAADFGPTNTSGAAFRSLPPKANGVRYFPNLNAVKKGELTLTDPFIGDSWETLSEVPREYNFMATVRDNGDYGGVDQARQKVTVLKNAGPFEVSSQQLAVNYQAGSVQEVSWDVAGTNLSEIAEVYVDIYLSTDGGSSFPIQVADAVHNSGSAKVIIPNSATSEARIMVAAHDNIFFSMNTAPIAIEGQDFAVVGKQTQAILCKGAGQTMGFTYDLASSTSVNADLSVSDLPAGVTANLSIASLSEDGSSLQLTLTSDQTAVAGTYTMTLNATSSSHSQSLPLKLIVRDESIAPINLVSPYHTEQGVLQDVNLKWTADNNAAYYEFVLAQDENFTNITSTATTTFNITDVHDLSPDTIYYWKVRGINDCGTGTYSDPYSFQVAATECTDLVATDLPKTISDSRITTVRSEITFEQDLPIASIEADIKINHTWVNDLKVSLISPSGTKVKLLNYNCGNYDADINATFSDDGEELSCSSTGTAVSGTVKGVDPLSYFKGESSKGTWVLEVVDSAELDGGSIENFTLKACFQGTIRPDADGDGVFDDGDDLCLGTPFGQKVDTYGCPVNQLDKNNFLLTVNSQSCVGNPDGSIELNAVTSMSYTYSVSGPNGYSSSGDFISNTSLSNLAVGDYEFCIVGTDGDITYDEVCLNAVITEPETLSVLTAITYEDQELNLSLEGSTYYTVEVNDQSYYISGKQLDVPLEEGYNKIKVSGDLACMGSYEEEIYFSKLPVAYPNPIKETFFINTNHLKDKKVSIRIQDLNGHSMYTFKGRMRADDFGFDSKYWSKGIYVMQLQFEQTTVIYKLIKE